MNKRSGYFARQPKGYSSFKAANLPPDPELYYDPELLSLLSLADRKLGRLDGITQVLPNPDLFVSMYVQKEALLSSQIEGTQASLLDVLDKDNISKEDREIEDVVNYVSAMKYGLARLEKLPLSLRLIREMHKRLLATGRGSKKEPGLFRTSQNWIGYQGCPIEDATFVPPCPDDMHDALHHFELFLYQEDSIPDLIKIALIHAQFETIHPFQDGNGRMGRLLITLWLCQKGILSQPLLYLSYYFKKNRAEYYDRLMDARLKGDWENWLKFFLKGVATVSDEAVSSAKRIISLRERLVSLASNEGKSSKYQLLINEIFASPILSKKRAAELLSISYPSASSLINEFLKQGILVDATPHKARNKKYLFEEYMQILSEGTELNKEEQE